MKNILFLYSSVIDPNKGGVQRVTHTLAKSLLEKKNNVYFLSLESLNLNDNFNFEKDCYYTLPNKIKINSNENKLFFKKLIKTLSIDIVINQGAISKDLTKLSYSIFSSNPNIKLFSVIHNSILANAIYYFTIREDYFKQKNIHWFKFLFNFSIIKKIILNLYKIKYKNHFKNLLKKSDKIIFLSPNLFKELDYFTTTIHYKEKLVSIHNPIPFNEVTSLNYTKIKEIIYVGRIDFSQKKIDYLLKIWSKIQDKHLDWKLTIIGGGNHLEQAKKMSIDLKLNRVSFEGFKNPIEYYKRASIFMMTSSFEGLPMSLIEATYFGVIPIAFNSFLSITDIIKDGSNGLIIKPFNLEEYAFKLSDLLKNETKIKEMMLENIQISKKFELKAIVDEWEKLFNQ